MTYPVIIITGKAGSGKDTLANFMAEAGNGVCVAAADPMKRFCQQVFGFSEQQLWGPSWARNAPDPRPASEFIRLWNDPSTFGAKAAWLKNIKAGGCMEELQTWARYVLGVEGLTPRHVLQKLGTEFGRSVNDGLWVDYVQDLATELLEKGGTYARGSGHLQGPQQAKFVIITDGRFKNEILATKARGGLAIRVDGGDGLSGAPGAHSSEIEQGQVPSSWFDYIVTNRKSDGLERLKTVAVALVQELLPAPREFRTDYLLSP